MDIYNYIQSNWKIIIFIQKIGYEILFSMRRKKKITFSKAEQERRKAEQERRNKEAHADFMKKYPKVIDYRVYIIIFCFILFVIQLIINSLK